jgi:hypothetical protein
MDPILLAQLINTVGTVGIPLVLKIKADIEAGRTATSVTDTDLTELHRLAALDSAAVYKNQGVALPPKVS